jgi:NAD(P)-dependent dehydrogenase (short-subunit alcohol dehydrogenase family)
LSDSLRRELMIYGIDVIVIGPGAVATPIWDKAEEQDDARFAGTVYAEPLRRFGRAFIDGGRRGLRPEEVGALVHHVLTTPRPRVRYAILRNRLLNWTIPKLLPPRVVDRMLAKRIGLQRPRS